MENKKVVFFDGHCLFCQGAVRFIVPRDPKGQFHFASLQSEVAKRLLEANGHQGDLDNLQTFVLLEDQQIYTRSTAALKVAKGLKWPWLLTYVFFFVPRLLRDGVYNWIAKHRYRWFGRSEQCMLPTPQMRERFIEED